MKRINKVPDAGGNTPSQAAHVGDVMTHGVITVTRHQTLEQARTLMQTHGIHSVPVVDKEREPIGVVTSTDLMDRSSGDTLIGQVMTRHVYTVPQYSGLHIAARMMRNHRIHHLLVTHEKKLVGIVSSFDLLKLVEDRRFVMKSQPTRPKKGGGGRRKQEDRPADAVDSPHGPNPS